MAKISKEELRKKIKRSRKEKNQTKPINSKTETTQKTTEIFQTDLPSNLKRLGIITLIIFGLLILTIYLKNSTDLFTRLAGYLYKLIN
jgi:hypothetical protein